MCSQQNSSISKGSNLSITDSGTLDEGAAGIGKLLENSPEDFAGILDDDDDAAADFDHPEAGDEDATAQSSESDEAEGETDEDDLDLSEEGDEESEDTTADEEKSSDKQVSDETVLFTADDGTQVTLAEAKKGYLRQSDFTRKSQANAEVRRQNEARAQELKRVGEVMDVILNEVMPPEPDFELSQTNPVEYTQMKARRDQFLNKVSQYYEYLDGVEASQRERDGQETEKQRQEVFQKEIAALREARPELATDEKLKAFVEDTQNGLNEFYGVTPQEIAGVVDSRWARIMNDAVRYRKALARSKAGKKNADTSGILKPGQTSTGKSRRQKEHRANLGKASDALRKTGRIEAGAQAIAALFGDDI